MMQERIMLRVMAWVGALAITASGQVAGAAEMRWVQGSWVNVRATPSNKAAVVDHLIVNTEVQLLGRQGEWCEILRPTPAVRGFLSCSLLGTQAVSLAEIGQMISDQGNPNPRYSATRAFWLQPSVIRLLEAGRHFWNTRLTEAQKNREHQGCCDETGNANATESQKRPNPVRYPIPEFEAMKDLMKQGVVAARENKTALPRWADLQQAARANPAGEFHVLKRWLPSGSAALLRAGRFGAVGVSLFKKPEDLAPAASTVENLSAHFGIVERLKILGGPQWSHFRHDDPSVKGSWDIGSYEITLEKPVYEYTIGRKGLATVAEWVATSKFDVGADVGCSSDFNLAPRTAKTAKGLKVLPDYPVVRDPLVWFFVPRPLNFKKVRITTAAKRLDPAKDKRADPYGEPTLLLLHEIDLDGDGTPDLAVWEGMLRDGTGGDRLGLRLVFANIGGEWFLLDSDYLSECT